MKTVVFRSESGLVSALATHSRRTWESATVRRTAYASALIAGSVIALLVPMAASTLDVGSVDAWGEDYDYEPPTLPCARLVASPDTLRSPQWHGEPVQKRSV